MASREQLDLAVRLGIERAYAEGLSSKALSVMIQDSPATDEQQSFLKLLVTYLPIPLPEDLTYGQASRILDEVSPIVFDRVITKNGWEVGTVLAWKGSYFRICAIHSNYTLTLEPVDLEPSSNGGPAIVVPRQAKKERRYPVTLDNVAEVIDVTTWQPS